MKLLATSNAGKNVVTACNAAVSHWFNSCEDMPVITEMMVVTPDEVTTRIQDLPAGDEYLKIHTAWKKSQSNESSHINAWRDIEAITSEILSSVGIREINSYQNRFVCLLPLLSFEDSVSILHNMISLIVPVIHLRNNCCLLHASGIERCGKAFLMIGPSGAGKTTAANICKEAGYNIIHDDHVLLSFSNTGELLARDRSNRTGPFPISGLFFLKKHKGDNLRQLSSQDVAFYLRCRAMDLIGNRKLYSQGNEELKRFTNRAAGCIPGFELEFTNSSNFLRFLHDAATD